MVSPYCEIDGVDFSALIKSEGVDISGGGAGVTEISTPYRNYADVRNSGRKMKKYTITTILTSDRAAIEKFLETVNNADEDAKFYPFDAERFGMIASAHASISSAMALDRQLYQARAEITCREPWLYGPSQGIDLKTVCRTPQSVRITANNIRTPIRELRVSGQLDQPIPEYPSNLRIRITPGSSTAEWDRYILLCEKMLRSDLLTMNWRGEIVHSWEADLTKSLAALAVDVHGKIRGGSISSGVLTLDNSDYLMVPFYGPLPLSGDPGAARIEVVISAIAGDEATVQVAKKFDLSDMAPIDHDTLVVGTNKIFIPELTGEGYVAIGLKAGASGSVSITGLLAAVKRYVAASRVPYANPGEDFQIRVETSGVAQLKLLQVDYNHRYYY